MEIKERQNFLVSHSHRDALLTSCQCDPGIHMVRDLFVTEEITQLLVDMTNLQGRRYQSEWRDLDATDLQAYIGVLILASVYRSRNELTRSLWDDHTGRAIFWATMSQHKFRLINSSPWFYYQLTRPGKTSWLPFGPSGRSECILSPCCSTRARMSTWTSSSSRLEAAVGSTSTYPANRQSMA